MSRDRSIDTADERTALLSEHSRSNSCSCSEHGFDEEDGVGHDHGHGYESFPERRNLLTSKVDSHLKGQWMKNLVLLVGVFLVNSDSCILLVLFRQIASDFDELSSASWVINSYLIGLIVAQPLYGKLSDIYGRKPLLLIAYSCYCVGSLMGGLGFSFWVLLLGRAICGIGNGGITVLISTLIVDLVPVRDVAVWRSYVYAVNQIGRAVAPSLGGFIADTLGWRWSLLYQAPLNFLGLIFVWWEMSFPAPPSAEDGPALKESCGSKLRRIDFSGSISLALTNCSLLLFLDQIQRNQDFTLSLNAILPLSTWVGFLVVFVAVEAFWAREPILPLRLLVKRNVFSSYCIQFLQTAAQVAFYSSIPLYFRITRGDSSTTVGVRLLFITIGTIVGGLMSGIIIKRTGRYRLVNVVSIVLSNISFLAVFFRWRGTEGQLETLYGFPIGLGFGVSLSAAFIGLTADLPMSEVAVSTSGFYLSLNLGSLIGVSSASLLIGTFVKNTLRERLHDLPDASKIIHDVTSNIDNINHLPPGIWEIVIETYSRCFINVWCLSLIFGCLALAASLVMRER